MSNVLTEVRKALLARLETIQPANGYRTSIGGNVRSGWFNEVVKDGGVPADGLVVVQRAKGQPPARGPHALKMLHGFNVIAAIEAGLDDYEQALEDIELDLLSCLCPTEGIQPDWLPKLSPNLRVGAPEPMPPGDGLQAASVLVPIHIIAIVDLIDN